MAPVLHCEKEATPAGQDQQYLFYYLLDAIKDDGSKVEIRQPVSRTTITQLQSQITRATDMVALAKATT